MYFAKKGVIMKKIFLLFIMGIVIMINSGCDKLESSNTSEIPLEIRKQNSGEELLIDIKELNLFNQEIYYMGRGYLKRGDPTDFRNREVIVYIVKETQSSEFRMIVSLKSEFLICDLGNFDGADSQGMVWLADIDKDGDDEIILNMETGRNRSTIARIYKITSESINLFYDLNEMNRTLSNNYGYEYEYLDNYKLKIVNINANFENICDLSQVLDKSLFDKNGRVPQYEKIEFRSFDARVQVNVDSYGKIELKYLQHLTLYDNTIIGYTITSLEYNQQTGDLDVCNAEFIFNQYFYNWSL